jgi:hypothetical protein
MDEIPRTYADVESFITLLQVACEDAAINSTLQTLLSQPDQTRRAVVLKLAERMRGNAAAPEFIDAIVCLLDDEVAERAYQVIYQCARKAK